MTKSENILKNYTKLAPASMVQGADKVLELKKQNKLWESIEVLIKLWQKTHPEEWDAHLIEIEETRDTRKKTWVGNKEFTGVSKDKETGGHIRYTLDIPQKLIYMIRAIYKPEELPMNKKFFREFGSRFPVFIVSEVKK